MEQRRLRLGDILDDYCPRERRVTNHAVVAMIEDDVKHETLDIDESASVLRAIVSQRLLPRIDGKGRVPAVEVLISTAFIRDAIMDKEKTHLIHGAIAQGTSQYGMQTFDQSIFSLYEQGLVSYEEALRWASNVDEFKLKVQGISTTADMARDQMAQAGQKSAGGSPEITRFGG